MGFFGPSWKMSCLYSKTGKFGSSTSCQSSLAIQLASSSQFWWFSRGYSSKMALRCLEFFSFGWRKGMKQTKRLTKPWKSWCAEVDEFIVCLVASHDINSNFLKPKLEATEDFDSTLAEAGLRAWCGSLQRCLWRPNVRQEEATKGQGVFRRRWRTRRGPCCCITGIL